VDSAIEIQNASVAFGAQTVFRDLTASIRKNSVTAVLGKSGSGKSTFLQLINGMVRPGSGTVRVSGKPIDYNALSDLRLSIGYVVQNTGLFPHLTVGENIMLLARVTRCVDEKVSLRIQHLMDMAQIPPSFLGKFPHELSGGEQQRVGLCRALLLNPPVVLMDEPFASLDGSTKQGIYSYVQAFQQTEPRTIVLVTHDWEEAGQLADDFILLGSGNIEAKGNNAELKSIRPTVD